MICFRDMTFCPYYHDCAKRLDCPRPLTDEVLEAAKQWWGKPGAPISQFSQKPACHEPEK